MSEERVGFALTGSFCTLETTLAAMEALAEDYPDILPIVSPAVADTDTRFGRAEDFHAGSPSSAAGGSSTASGRRSPLGPGSSWTCW